jgi:hypothetical protein
MCICLGCRGAAGEKHFVSHVLAFFAASDGIVVENLGVRFLSGETKCECTSRVPFPAGPLYCWCNVQPKHSNYVVNVLHCTLCF